MTEAVQQISRSIFQHRWLLHQVFAHLDADQRGSVNFKEFQVGWLLLTPDMLAHQWVFPCCCLAVSVCLVLTSSCESAQPRAQKF